MPKTETAARLHLDVLRRVTPTKLARRANQGDIFAKFLHKLNTEADKIVSTSAEASLKFDIHSQRARRQAIREQSNTEIARLAHHGNIFAQREMPRIKKEYTPKHTEDTSHIANVFDTPEAIGIAKAQIAILLARLDEPNDEKIRVIKIIQDYPQLIPATLQNLTAKAVRLKR